MGCQPSMSAGQEFSEPPMSVSHNSLGQSGRCVPFQGWQLVSPKAQDPRRLSFAQSLLCSTRNGGHGSLHRASAVDWFTTKVTSASDDASPPYFRQSCLRTTMSYQTTCADFVF